MEHRHWQPLNTLNFTLVSVCHRSLNSSSMRPLLRQWKTANWKGIKASGASIVSYSLSTNPFSTTFKSLNQCMGLTSDVTGSLHFCQCATCLVYGVIHHHHHCWTGLHRPEPHSPQRCKTCLNRRFSQLPVQRTQKTMVRSCSDNTNSSHQNQSVLSLHNTHQMPSARVHSSDTPKVNETHGGWDKYKQLIINASQILHSSLI